MKSNQKITLNSSFAFSTIIVLLIALFPIYTSWFITIFFLGFALIYTFKKNKSKSSKLIAIISYPLFVVAFVYSIINSM
ncbi:hypothetical protein [Bacillus atrophaeus]|uniref:DUF3953 domain-containing protein n=1 Tax=Bacillus atrophaeus (strain 1942) TaxID=720555 RepID=A0ABM5LWS2_BACA1|nr:hypothetical protein [Bacillus atrophaeus]AMR62820.1 hypothetical protein A1D11_10600 [Bacillus subtilis subsp. globigii]ADP32291.1 hypothetical protein BATR1942_06695 [Bacillus atrophaeus 1942]AIK45733.1 putative membrane protein [Bacillus atrophaeus subsp. globigii]EIM09057.1 hypothetical protein UY9_19329 [Bacillus atrophaeus C89]MBG9761964.1 hypothetical protein [Bacillus atrophaeus]